MISKHSMVDGIRMRWEEEGEGVPVVFLHGIPTSPALWRHVIPRIQGGRCLAWEFVGYGDSMGEARGRDISVRRQAEYLVAWMRDQGIARAVLVGHDLGGGAAHIAAAREPDVCVGLVLVNSIGYDSWPIPRVKALRSMGSLLDRVPRPALKLMLAEMLFEGHDDRERARESIAIHWKPYQMAGAGAFARQVRALDVRDTLAVAERVPAIDVPSRVVWGAADRFQKVAYGERFARDLGAELTRIPEGKHFVPEDHPDRVAEAVNDVLRQVGVRQGGGSSPGAG